MLQTFLHLLLIATFIHSKEFTFKNVTLLKEQEFLTTIPEANNIKDYLPSYRIRTLNIQGRITILYEDSITDIANVRNLYFKNNGIEDIHPGAFKNFNEVYALGFGHENLTIIKRNVFNDLPVKLLIIIENPQLDTIEEGALDNPYIEALILNNNHLNRLSKNTFSKLPNLKILLLQENHIDVIQEDIFKNLAVETLDLTGNQIATIPPQLLSNLPKLVKFFMDSNRLTTIPSGIFNGHKTLQEVSVALNKISSVDSNAFDDMPALRNVTLALNNINKIDNNWFRNDPHLININFVRNSIQEIPDQAFKNLVNDDFVTLSFRENEIKKIHPDAFKGLRNIEYLELSDNKIEEWNSSFLEGVHKVVRLDLSFNRIKCVEGELDRVFKADYTELSFNPLEKSCLKRIEEWKKSPASKGKYVAIELDED